MSLINDALKRAKEARPAPANPRPAGPRMLPAEAKSASLWPLLLIPIVLVGLFAIAVILLLKGIQSSYHQNQPPPPNPVPSVAAREITPAPAATTLELPPVPPLPKTANPLPGLALSESASPPAPAIPDPLSNQDSHSFPQLKLQAIFYRETKPSVMINSETLFLNDVIQQVRVTKITRDGVTLEWRNETRELSLK